MCYNTLIYYLDPSIDRLAIDRLLRDYLWMSTTSKLADNRVFFIAHCLPDSVLENNMLLVKIIFTIHPYTLTLNYITVNVYHNNFSFLPKQFHIMCN